MDFGLGKLNFQVSGRAGWVFTLEPDAFTLGREELRLDSLNLRLGAWNTLERNDFAPSVSFPVAMRLSVRLVRLSVSFQWYSRLGVR